MTSRPLPPTLNPDRVRADLARGQANRDHLESIWRELITQHEDSWVACDGATYVVADSLDALLTEARRSKFDLKTMAVGHLSESKIPRLLLT